MRSFWSGLALGIVVSAILPGGAVYVFRGTSVESARAALALVRKHGGDKPVVAVVYSHSHADHFAGVAGITTTADVEAGRVKVIAPEGFMEHAVAENIIAGVAMTRRARFQFGVTLPRGAEGEMTSGLGPGLPRGTVSLIAPTDVIAETGAAWLALAPLLVACATLSPLRAAIAGMCWTATMAVGVGLFLPAMLSHYFA